MARVATPRNNTNHFASGVGKQATSTKTVLNVLKNIGTEAGLLLEEDRDKQTHHPIGKILQRHTVHILRVPDKRIKAEEQVKQLR